MSSVLLLNQCVKNQKLPFFSICSQSPNCFGMWLPVQPFLKPWIFNILYQPVKVTQVLNNCLCTSSYKRAISLNIPCTSTRFFNLWYKIHQNILQKFFESFLDIVENFSHGDSSPGPTPRARVPEIPEGKGEGGWKSRDTKGAGPKESDGGDMVGGRWLEQQWRTTDLSRVRVRSVRQQNPQTTERTNLFSVSRRPLPPTPSDHRSDSGRTRDVRSEPENKRPTWDTGRQVTGAARNFGSNL